MDKKYLDLDIWDDTDWLRQHYGNLEGKLKTSIVVKSGTHYNLMSKFVDAFNKLGYKTYILVQDKVVVLSGNMYLIEFTLIPKV